MLAERKGFSRIPKNVAKAGVPCSYFSPLDKSNGNIFCRKGFFNLVLVICYLLFGTWIFKNLISLFCAWQEHKIKEAGRSGQSLFGLKKEISPSKKTLQRRTCLKNRFTTSSCLFLFENNSSGLDAVIHNETVNKHTRSHSCIILSTCFGWHILSFRLWNSVAVLLKCFLCAIQRFLDL